MISKTSTNLHLALLFFISSITVLTGQKTENIWTDETFKGLEMRSIGPAFMAGRIADIAISPEDESVWYVAVGSGGLWKTENNGISWITVFDNQPSYSTGCVTIDPNNPSTIWLGTGENVGGRHVGYGDGIYRSTNDGKTWENMGLKKSEHISKIIINPKNSDIIWVAAQGPLWSKGGDRGFYKSTDAGKTWKKTLGDEEWTGVTDILLDPRNPNRLYAATWQRHRTIAAYMGGGPKTSIYRSEDGGDTWTELKEGLPAGNKGKIGLALSHQNPDVIYAAIEMNQREGGVFKSTNRGNTWAKQSDAVSGATGPHYYQELYSSPHHEGKLYLMDVRVQISDDGGKNFHRMKENHKHSDNHTMAFKMSDPNYLLVGTDGGLYESFDLGENWRFIANMPITQFYKLAVDDSEPFYKIYGGTQDNSTQGGPSRTDNAQGIQNSDWKIVLFADGHQPATEPGNPNVVYAQWQEGHLARIDMQTGEVVDIQPQPDAGEAFERYNWDAPILVSPHKPSRIYFASQRLWKSENRGDTWVALSGDLTKNQNRIELPIMGRKQSWDNAWDFYAMSTFNTITSIAVSPVKEGIIYIGTDDGLIQKTTDNGANWTRLAVSSLPGAPATAYVNDIKADLYDENTVYVALDNHKHGDFKPYLYKSTNNGKSWTNIGSTLPERHIVWRLVQDHVNKDLLFTGTEFGIFFSVNGGKKWMKIQGGVPNIPFRDITIQRRDNDLVGASFGRSFYVFDDMSVFREFHDSTLTTEASLFNTRKAWWYFPKPDLAFGGAKGSMGEAHFVAENPPFGAVFTYYLKDGYKTAKATRQETEKKLEADEDVPFPGWDALDSEASERGTIIWLTVTDANGDVIRKVKGSTEKGFHRVNWDLRYPSPRAVRMGQSESNGNGMLAPPGEYYVQLQKENNGKITDLSKRRKFMVEELNQNSLTNPQGDKRDDFWRSYDLLVRNYSAFTMQLNNAGKKMDALILGFNNSNIQSQGLAHKMDTLYDRLQAFEKQVMGNSAKNKVGEKVDPRLEDRIQAIARMVTRSTYGPTTTAMKQRSIAINQLGAFEAELAKIEEQMEQLAQELVDMGGPVVEGF